MEYTALSFYETQTVQGPLQFLVAGAIKPQQPQGVVCGLAIFGANNTSDFIPVRSRLLTFQTDSGQITEVLVIDGFLFAGSMDGTSGTRT